MHDRPPYGPHVAAASVAIAAFFVGAVLPAAAWPLVDPDTWWHIRAGQEVIATGSVPRTDAWSIVGAGRSWTSQDWLANVLLAVGFEAGPWGWTALSLAFGALTMAAVGILWQAVGFRSPGVGWLSRIAFLSAGFVLATTILGVRVQVIDLLMATLVVWIVWRYMVDPRWRWIVLLPAVAVLWANLHAGWILLFLIGGAVLVGESVDRLLRRSVAGRPPLSWESLGRLAAGLLASVVALALNPNGLDLYRYPFDTIGITTLSRYILEWFPATLDRLPGQLLLGFTVVVVVPTLVLGRRHLRTADVLILVGLTIMAFTAIRFLLLVGPIGGAIAALALGPTISASQVGRRTSDSIAALSEPRAGARGWLHLGLTATMIVVGLGAAVGRVSPAQQASAISEALPADAAMWLDEQELDGRMFNRYEWGGYLGQQRPHVQVFMDGRADVYGDELLRMYVSLITLATDPQAVLDRYEIDVAIYPPATPLGRWFDSSISWIRVYGDGLTGIWRRA